MKRYLLSILFISFWSCEDATSGTAKESITGSWDYYYFSKEYQENSDWNLYGDIDSVVYNFTDNGTLTVVDTKISKDLCKNFLRTIFFLDSLTNGKNIL